MLKTIIEPCPKCGHEHEVNVLTTKLVMVCVACGECFVVEE